MVHLSLYRMSSVSNTMHSLLNLLMGCGCAGAMRLGEYLFCSVESGCKPCPICRSKVCSAAHMVFLLPQNTQNAASIAFSIRYSHDRMLLPCAF